MSDGTMRLLEREGELAQVETALHAALAGQGRLVVVEGSAGIGKSALLGATAQLARARGARPLSARGLELEREFAFGAVRQLFDPIVQAATAEARERVFMGAAAPARALFDTAAPVSGLAADREFATMNAFYWLLAGLADDEPLALLVDDAHWLDQPSLRLLDFLGPRIGELRTLLVVATRPPLDDRQDAPLGRLLVNPASSVIQPHQLSRAAVAELVHMRLGEQPDPAFIDNCADVTAGNPFYLSELLRELAGQGAQPRAAFAAEVRSIAPRGISLAVRFRDGTSAEGLALARALAVLGDGARLEDVAALADLEHGAAAGAADALTRQSILAPGTGLAFAHPIVRTAVYADLAPHERSIAHARAARLLDSAAAPIERIAAHLLRTDPERAPRVVELLRAAGAAAVGHGAPDVAVSYLRRALIEAPDDAVRPRLLLELGRAEAATADRHAPGHLAEAYALASDVRTRAQAAMSAAFPLASEGRMGEAIVMLDGVVEELTRQDPDAALEPAAQMLALAMNDPASAADHLPRLDRISEDLAGDTPGARMMLSHLAYRRMWRSRDAAHAAELALRAIADGQLLAERGSDASEINSAALTLICADRLEPAAQLLDAALAQAQQRGSRHGFTHVSSMRSVLAYRRGALRDAEADSRTVLTVALPAGLSMAAAVGTGMLIACLLERGARDDAAEALSAIGFAEGEIPPLLPYNLLLSARGRLRLAHGDLAGGLADLLECGRRNAILEARNPLLVPWRIDAALAHLARRELQAARALSDEEFAAARDWGTPGAIGSAQRLRALLAAGDEAIEILHDATVALSQSPARLEHARALVDLGAALRRANRRSEARQPLRRGLDLAEHCHATLLCRRAREELAATGARPRRSRLTGLESLTASERRVAEMAARGLGNNAIAQTLFVTRKTVEKHLGNVYMKLGVKSRAELPEQLSRHSDPQRNAGH